MDRVTLIQCTNSKRDVPAPAWYLYDESGYFRKMRRWAWARGNPWFILSAKHGLVDPSDPIEPYDDRGLSERQGERIADVLDGMGVRVVDVQAGRGYTGPLTPALEACGIDVIEHFAGEPIGKRQQLLGEAAAELEHATL